MAEVTLKEKAYQELKKLIISGELTHNEVITERALAQRLQMSRTPIRSAVEKLEADGLIVNTPNKGIFIIEVSLNKVVDFFDFRMAIESYVVRKISEKSLSECEKEPFLSNLEEQKNPLKVMIITPSLNWTRNFIACWPGYMATMRLFNPWKGFRTCFSK